MHIYCRCWFWVILRSGITISCLGKWTAYIRLLHLYLCRSVCSKSLPWVWYFLYCLSILSFKASFPAHHSTCYFWRHKKVLICQNSADTIAFCNITNPHSFTIYFIWRSEIGHQFVYWQCGQISIRKHGCIQCLVVDIQKSTVSKW